MRNLVWATTVLVAVFLAQAGGDAGPPANVDAVLASSAPHNTVSKKLARFAKAPIGVKPGRIKAKDVRLLGKLIEAADALDEVFWLQVSEDGLDVYQALLGQGSEPAVALADLMGIHYGPWDRLDGQEPFVGNRQKPAGAAFYPADLSRRELRTFMDEHPEMIGDILAPYTVVRRKSAGLVTIPYSEKYRSRLENAAVALREAAAFSEWKSLKDFLLARADALTNDDYYASEMKWMETDDCPYVVVMGPYEFYEDHLMGSKAAFEAIIALKDEDATRQFKGLGEEIPGILEALPLPGELKDRLVTTRLRPITVADEIYAAGDTRAGAQTTAFTLPNDMRVREKKGTRQVILRNVARAKFNHSWLPLSRRVVAEEQNVEITFESYYSQLASVELARAIRPAPVTLDDGTKGEVRIKLRQRYHAFEEAKSDALGIFVTLYLMDKGLLPKRPLVSIGATYIASVFRVIRFDQGGAHGMAKAVVFNALARRGGIEYDPTTRRYYVNEKKFRTALEQVLVDLFDVLVNGDYDKAGRMIIEYGLLSADVSEKLAELDSVPVDIQPQYSILSALKK